MDIVNYTIVIGFIYSLGEVMPSYDKFTTGRDQKNTILRSATTSKKQPKRVIKHKDVHVVVIPHTRNGIVQCCKIW